MQRCLIRHDIAFAHVVARARPLDVIDDGTMRNRHAFRRSRGARGVDNVGGIGIDERFEAVRGNGGSRLRDEQNSFLRKHFCEHRSMRRIGDD